MRLKLCLPSLAFCGVIVLSARVAWAGDGAWFGDDGDAPPAGSGTPAPATSAPEPAPKTDTAPVEPGEAASTDSASDDAAPTVAPKSKSQAKASTHDSKSSRAKCTRKAKCDKDDNWGPPTLLGHDGKLAFGGYGGVTALGTRINGVYGALIGGEAAFLLDHRLAIGVGGMGLATDVEGPHASDGTRSRLEFGYGGLVLEANLLGSSPVYLSIGGLLGAGAVGFCAYGPHRYEVQCNRDGLDESVFFVAEPRVALRANVTRWLRLGVEGRYRFTEGVNTRGLGDGDIKGASAGGSIEFGWF